MLNHIASQIGQTEDDGDEVSHAVKTYLEAAGITLDGPPSRWNAALLAWAAIRSGIVPPINAADPLSWLSWGSALAGPVPGAVVVLTDGSGRTAFLCGVVARVQARKVYVIGSFDRAVQPRCFPIEQVIGARRPPGSSQLQPVPLVIEHEPQPVQAAPLVQPIAIARETEIVSQPHPAPAQPEVRAEHLDFILATIQDKFRAVDSRIDAVQNHALAAVNFQETTTQ